MALTVHVWSDIVCPWCYLGKRRLESAIKRSERDVDIIWHAFELDPLRTNEQLSGMTPAQRLAKKYAMPEDHAALMMEQMKQRGLAEGIDFRLNEAQTLQTFDAHRLLQFASEHKKQTDLMEHLFRAHFTDSLDIGDKSVLSSLAQEIGLPVDEAGSILEGDDYAADVRQDESSARELGITGVPFFVIGRTGIPGAQQSDTLLQAIVEAEDDLVQAGGVASLAPHR